MPDLKTQALLSNLDVPPESSVGVVLALFVAFYDAAMEFYDYAVCDDVYVTGCFCKAAAEVDVQVFGRDPVEAKNSWGTSGDA